MTRAVALNEHDIREIQKLGNELLEAGDIRASKLLTLALAWRYAPEVPRTPVGTHCVNNETFACDIDESAGLYELDPFSRRVSA